MTKIRILTAAISMFGLLLAPAAFAEQAMESEKATESTPTQPSSDEEATESMPTQPSEIEGKEVSIFKASEVIGYSVKSAQGDELGKIEDIVIDPKEGRVEYAVLSVGGFLGMGDKLFAIPWDALIPMPQQQAFSLDVSKEQLEQTPGFDKDNWPNLASREFGARVPSSYGQTPHEQEGSEMESTPGHPSTDESTGQEERISPKE